MHQFFKLREFHDYMSQRELVSIIQGYSNKLEILYDTSSGEGIGFTKEGPIPITLPKNYDYSTELPNRRQYFVERHYFDRLLKATKILFSLAEGTREDAVADGDKGVLFALQDFPLVYRSHFQWNTKLW